MGDINSFSSCTLCSITAYLRSFDTSTSIKAFSWSENVVIMVLLLSVKGRKSSSNCTCKPDTVERVSGSEVIDSQIFSLFFITPALKFSTRFCR